MGKSLNILVIEDSKDDVFLLTRELRRNGYSLNYERVYTPNDMQTALKKGQWDVILCDYVMPNFSAPAALELMKNSGLDLPFIVVSGAMGEESAVAVMRAGAHDYLTKDKLIRLVPVIEREMQEAANRRERRRAVELATRLGRILDNSSNEIYVFDATSFKFTQTNRSARENLGYSQEELAHLTPMELQPQPDNEALITQFKALYARERDEIVYETLFRRRDGSTYPVEARLHLSDSETPPVFVAIARDITERKRSEAALYFLAEASIKLVSELDYGNIFRTVAQLAVPFLADLCIVDVVTEDNMVARVAVIHADPSKVELTRELEKFSAEATRAGYYLDLMPLANEDKTLNPDDFFPSIWQSFQWDNGLWAMPFSADAFVLSYNPDAFDRAGIAYPNDKWTIDDLSDAVRKLAVKGADGKVTTPGIDVTPGILPYLLRGMLNESLFDSTTIPNTPKFATPETAALLDAWYKLDTEGLVGQEFGKAPLSVVPAIVIALQPATSPGEKRAGALLPGGKATISVQGFAVSVGTQHPEQAYALAQWLTTRGDIANNGFASTPARKSLLGKVGDNTPFQLNISPEVKALIDQAIANAIPLSELRFVDYLSAAYAKMKSDKIDAQTALQTAEADAVKAQANARYGCAKYLEASRPSGSSAAPAAR